MVNNMRDSNSIGGPGGQGVLSGGPSCSNTFADQDNSYDPRYSPFFNKKMFDALWKRYSGYGMIDFLKLLDAKSEDSDKSI